MRRHEISGARWGLVADFLPRPSRRGGGRWRDHRQVLNGLLWRLCAGTRWRDLPERYGPWQTVHGRLPRWRRDGTLDRVLDRLRLRLDAEGMVDLDTWCVDGTFICAGRSAAGARKKPSRASPRTMRSGARAAASRPSSTS